MESTLGLAVVQRHVDRFVHGDGSARNELLADVCDRMQRLTRKMLHDFPEVHRWEQTDDVCQNALLRLWRSLEHVPLVDARHFFRLAALQIRRELIDLVRHYRGKDGLGAHHATRTPRQDQASQPPLYDRAEVSHDPQRLAEWQDFHQYVDRLPDEQREVFDLLWYHDLSQDEAAELLGVNVRTVKRRWREARLKLHQLLGDQESAFS
jgi:RNA polymerase sigma-70 factor (ECF subfamily)